MPAYTETQPSTTHLTGIPACILLRSSWQTVNIGDIGHSPGVLALLENRFPESKMILWAGNLDRGVREMLMTRFPRLTIVHGDYGIEGECSSKELAKAIEEADILIHGSGPSLVAMDHVKAWEKNTTKPCVVYGITVDPLHMPAEPTIGESLKKQKAIVDSLPTDYIDAELRDVLIQAQYVFCRDSITVDYLRAQKVGQKHVQFAPDGAFGCDLRDEKTCEAILKVHDLKDNAFICVIPRMRFTPYHDIQYRARTLVDDERLKISESFFAEDMSKLSVMITKWVEETGLPVLLCPEMTYQVEVSQKLYDEFIPDSVKPKVRVLNEYWITDAACSVFARSRCVVSLDNHSPIFALAANIPTIFVRQPSDTTKGQMWFDIGMEDWFFEIDETSGELIAQTLLTIHRNYDVAKAKVQAILNRVSLCQSSSLEQIASCMGVGSGR